MPEDRGREPVGSGRGTLCGDRGSLLGASFFFSLAPLDKTSSFVSLFPSLHSPGGPTPALESMSVQNENTQPQELWTWVAKSQWDLAKSILIGAPGGKKGPQKPVKRWGR